ncbi:MAG: helix-turn-helix domain-containing protein [Hyphomicrobium sp.]|jgi:transcriptional regulator with XRE-family HTH domain
MIENWSSLVRHYRLRHGISQERMALVMNVSQRTISRWERGDDQPSIVQQKRLRDLGWEPSGSMFRSLAASILHCPAPRALSRTENIRLELVSKPALEKRPSVAEWIGRDLAPIACGVLQEILDDAPLQRAIIAGEISSLVTTTRSVLRTEEHAKIGLFRTTITYFFHEGTLYNDAIGFPAPDGSVEGYAPVPMDEVAIG